MTRPLLLVALVLAAVGCTGADRRSPADPMPPTQTPVSEPAPRLPGPPTLGAPFTIERGGSAALDGVALTFEEVTENSRCPEDTPCVWPGRAVVRLAVEAGGQRAEVAPELAGISDEPTPKDTLGYRFTLLTLLFDPAPPGQTGLPVATLLVERSGG